MARIKIDLPEQFIFSTELVVYADHINYGNHLDNAALIGLVSEARMRFFAALGFSEADTEGAGIIVADAAIQYKSEGFRGETLVFDYAVRDFSRVGCDLVYRVLEKTSGREVARGKTGIVFFDYAKRETVPVPAGFIKATSRAAS
jgi:4-hydroxybenzoyl-CoA thioesterase